MKSLVRIFSHREGLSAEENIIYRNFNILLFVALLDLVVILSFLKGLEQQWPLYICLAEFFCYIVLLVVHSKGYMLVARYLPLLATLVVQCAACRVHGESGGFDFVFFAVAVWPMLYSEARIHYLSRFPISITTLLAMPYSYSSQTPLISIEGDLIY